jgi:hypothetical protein
MQANTAKRRLSRLLVLVGNFLTATGCIALIAVVSGLISADLFPTGAAFGVRAAGSVAITGCLMSAVGYGIVDYLEA